MKVSELELALIVAVIRRLAPDCEVWAFGSRVSGGSRAMSDLDLAFMGQDKLGFKRLAAIKEGFSESDLPYRVDVVDYRAVSCAFQKVIDRQKERIYPCHPASAVIAS